MDRKIGLDTPSIAASIKREMEPMEADQSWQLRCTVLMPDHIHLVVSLGDRLSLSQTMQRLKAKTAITLRTVGLAWERGFFDRKLRPDDVLLPVFLYVYLNPYRAGLITPTERWPHFQCGADDWSWLRTQLDQDLPPPAWIS